MRKLSDLQEIISAEVNQLTFPAYPAELYEPIKYILSLGGKRMRPALLLMACDLFGGDVQKAISPALAIEVFHNFIVIHYFNVLPMHNTLRHAFYIRLLAI